MNSLPKEAQSSLWICAGCTMWWECQPVAEPETWRLLKLGDMLEATHKRPGSAPAWKVIGPDPSVCPECGYRMCRHPAPTKSISRPPTN